MKDFIKALFNLQFFADGAGALVNMTDRTGSAYDGTSYTLRSASGEPQMAPELKEFYDTELLDNARMELRYAQFGKKQRLPKGHKGTVEWRKWNTFAKATALLEGVIPTGQKFGVTNLTGSISQYGTYTAITDILELRSYDDIILGATEEMGASAAATQETLIRNALLTGTNVLYCDNIGASGYISTPTGPSSMGAGGGTSGAHGWSTLTPTMINKAVAILKKNKAPTINGKYYAVIHPSVAFDLREQDGWLEAHKYAQPGEIFNGEIGELHGVRFIENVDAPVLKGTIGSTSYTNQDSGATYATYFFGKDAFGIIDPEGGALEMIVKDKSEIGGPLDQFSTIGYKFETNGATILYPERILRVMSCSSFSATDDSNY